MNENIQDFLYKWMDGHGKMYMSPIQPRAQFDKADRQDWFPKNMSTVRS